MKLKKHYKVVVNIEFLYEDLTFNQLQHKGDYETWATSEKQAINNIRFRLNDKSGGLPFYTGFDHSVGCELEVFYKYKAYLI